MSAPRKSSARVEPFGFWPTDFSASQAVVAAGDYADLCCDDQRLLWVELYPGEGRSLVMEWTPTGVRRLTPTGFSVRSRVYEYGGGALCLLREQFAFVNEADQQLYLQPLEATDCQPLTTHPARRYGGLCADTLRSRVIAVEETHDRDQVVHRLVAIDFAGERLVLVEGADFYSSPVISPDGCELAWVEWDRPELPWTATRLGRAALNDAGEILPIRTSGSQESIQQPFYDPRGNLGCLSDRSGYWMPWEVSLPGEFTPIPAEAADHGSAPWQQNPRHVCALPDGRLALCWQQEGFGHLALRDRLGGNAQRLAPQFTRFRALAANARYLYCVAGAPDCSAAIVQISLVDGSLTELRSTRSPAAQPSLSRPVALTYPTGSAETAHGFLYAPCNIDVQPPAGLPPLILFLHGGPTSACYPVLDHRIQFWTRRGFAVADLNYRGSAGYGRAYRNRLCGNWGVVDVEDCLNAVEYLAAAGLVDGNAVFIRGASAGGYTALASLAAAEGRFRAATSLYGVADLLSLRASTHKFEADYVDWLVGDPDRYPERYRARSPLHQVERISTPVQFFQGLDDPVVPPEQTERMVQALERRGVPVACLSFPNERHGFRSPANLERALDQELLFYRSWLVR
jgi:dipeptidyl aminopeptidase/acylaminoacyl peptidase